MMTRLLLATGIVMMLALPAFAAGSYATTAPSAPAAKGSGSTASGGRTLSDYNIQKE